MNSNFYVSNKLNYFIFIFLSVAYFIPEKKRLFYQNVSKQMKEKLLFSNTLTYSLLFYLNIINVTIILFYKV